MKAPTYKDRFRYRIDQFFQSGFTLQVTIAFSTIIGLIFVFYFFAQVFGVLPGRDFELSAEEIARGSDPYWPSVRFWWVLTHVLDTYWIELNTFEQIFATVMTLFNFLVFAAVIGLVGSKIQARLEGMRRGTSRAIESNHVIIIGWSEKIFSIIQQISIGLEATKSVFVILTERSMDVVESELRKELGRIRNVRWVIRTGSTTDMSDLELVSLQTARAIILLRQTHSKINADTQVVKSIIAVSHLLESVAESKKKPFLVAEIEQQRMHRIALAAARHLRLSIVQPSDYLSKIILQTALQHGLVEIYNELLSHERNEIHLHKSHGLEGQFWREAALRYRDAIPLGILRNGRPVLLPGGKGGDYVVAKGDELIVLARDSDHLDREIDATIPNIVSLQPSEDEPECVKRLLVLGYSSKLQTFLTEYSGYARTAQQTFQVTAVSHVFENARYCDAVETMKGIASSLEVKCIDRDYLIPGVLEELHPEEYDSIIVLGEEMLEASDQDSDTRVIMTLLLLRAMREQAQNSGAPFPEIQQIVGEILHPDNKELAESTGTVNDVIISNELISKMISQICREPMLEEILKDLFDEQGCEIYFKPIALYAGAASSLTFSEVLAASIVRGEIAIGVDIQNQGEGLAINPDKKKIIHNRPAVRVAVLAEKQR